MKVVLWFLLGLGLTGCGNRAVQTNPVAIDMSPVGCGYKWFQTGLSPVLEQSCEIARSDALRDQQTELAVAHAWEIATERCPPACPPRELHDPSEWEETYPDGVCREGRVYYTARVFFQCERR